MLKSIISVIGGILLGLSSMLILPLAWSGGVFDAQAESTDLLSGCNDIPEVVDLVMKLKERSQRIDRYLQEIDRKKKEIKVAESDLKATLVNLISQQQKEWATSRKTPKAEDAQQDIDRLISVYDQMKPERAAGVIEGLPPELSAEILMRLQPENSAKIMSSINVKQAAILTSYMGARHARN